MEGDEKVTDEVVYMSATEEVRHTVAQANAAQDAGGALYGRAYLPPESRANSC